MRQRKLSLTARMVALGFDLSRAVPFERGVRVRCSQCEALCINGIPTHERGCPNARPRDEHDETEGRDQ